MVKINLNLVIIIFLLLIIIYLTFFKAGLFEGFDFYVTEILTKVTDGYITQIVLYNDYIYGIGNNGHVYKKSLKNTRQSSTSTHYVPWEEITHGTSWVSYITIYNDYIYGIGRNFSVYRHSINNTGKDWIQVTDPAWLTQIVIGNLETKNPSVSDQYIYGLGSEGWLYKNPSIFDPKKTWWGGMGGMKVHNKSIDIYKDYIYSTSNDGSVYRRKYGTENWVLLSSEGFKIQIKIYKNYIYCLDKDGGIYRLNIDGTGSFVLITPPSNIGNFDIYKDYIYCILSGVYGHYGLGNKKRNAVYKTSIEPSRNILLDNCKVSKNHTFKGQEQYRHIISPGTISFQDCKKKCNKDPKCNYFKSGSGIFCQLFYDDSLSGKTSWEDFYNKMEVDDFKVHNEPLNYYTALPDKYCYNNFSMYDKDKKTINTKQK